MMRTSKRLVVLGGLFASAALAVGCKGETVIKPDPQTLADLEACRKTKDEKDKLIASLSEENAKLQREKGAGTEIVVAIEGTALTVKPGVAGAAPRPIDDKAAGEASKQFLDVVARSRGGIQKCYEQALKKDSSLQARTVTLTVSASFSDEGGFKTASFSPSLGDAFNTCMRTLAGKWVLPKNSPAMTFRTQVALTPS